MTIENDFLAFAAGSEANVLSQSAYAALTTLLQNGFQGGIAPSVQLNKVWRQSSIMSAVLAQFICDVTGQNAIDDGTTATLLANLKSAVGIQAIGRLLNIQVFDAVGASTYTKTAGATTAIVDVQGAGGQGGGSAACSGTQNSFGTGGHSGARGVAEISLSGVNTVAVTVGSGGSTGGAGASGQAGGTTSFGTYITCPGGPGGSVLGPTSSSFIGGNASTLPQPTFSGVLQTIISQSGNSGVPAQCITPGVAISGAGGISPAYGGSVTANVGTGAGNSGAQIGSGGSGAFTAASGSAQAGGVGIRGKIIVYEYA